MSNEDVEKTQKVHTNVQRQLSGNDLIKINDQDKMLVSSFRAQQLEDNAQKYWDQFYNRNKANFFKDRHWTSREFRELLGENGGKRSLLEVGCGAGNLIYPLLAEGCDMSLYACDFSQKAVNLVKSHQLYDPSKIVVFQADITSKELSNQMNDVVDIITLVFVLSAIHPDKFILCLRNLFDVMKPEGLVLFRDYGIHDMTQIRFKKGHKITENFYMRQDGTRSYFFTIEELTNLFQVAGFEQVSCSYVETRTVNKKEQVDVPRVFIQGKFIKPR